MCWCKAQWVVLGGGHRPPSDMCWCKAQWVVLGGGHRPPSDMCWCKEHRGRTSKHKLVEDVLNRRTGGDVDGQNPPTSTRSNPQPQEDVLGIVGGG
jgi:hypothetical protein